MVLGENSSIQGRRKKIKRVNWSIWSIFMHADKVDMCLMTLGSIGAVFDGFSERLPMVFTSRMINTIGSASKLDSDAFQRNINKVSFSPTISFFFFFPSLSLSETTRSPYLKL